jgi:LacI family transcriptional regulator
MNQEATYIGVLGSDSGRPSSQALRGIHRFAKANNVVVVDFGPLGSLAQQAEAIGSWPVQGVLTFAPGIQVGLHSVEMFTQSHSGRPRVDVEQQAITQAAFQHLRALNPQSINLLRTPRCSNELVAGWDKASADLASSSGDFQITSQTPSLRDISEAERDRFHEWLSHLERPAGIVCTTDAMAAACFAYCKHAAINIPDDIAIISCENSALADQLQPGLSGVSAAYENAGYEGARLLTRMIQGEHTASELTIISGVDVQPRASTDRMAALPDDIRVAQEYIRDNSCSGINVKDVMRTQDVSRVTFERRFKEHTGQTPGAEIRRIRLEKAESLLRETDASVTKIASQCGFEGSSRFSLFFRKRTGLSPSEYRKRHQ